MAHTTKRERRYAASFKFERIEALNAMQAEGGSAALAAGKAKRGMNDSWTKRQSTNVQGFHKPATALKRRDAGVVPAHPVLRPVGPAKRV